MAGRNEANAASPVMKGGSALFYGISSFSIMLINKVEQDRGEAHRALALPHAQSLPSPPLPQPMHPQIVLSIYEFPSFSVLAASQFLFTSVVILALKSAGKVQVTPLSWVVLRVMAPLILISLVNVLSGLGGTQKLNLPMFTVRTHARTARPSVGRSRGRLVIMSLKSAGLSFDISFKPRSHA